MAKSFLERLGKEWLFWDGGMGTLLQEQGLKGGEKPETWNLSHPDIIREIHRRYLLAGADILNTNTFGLNRLKFPRERELASVASAALRLAREARRESGREDAYIALDLGPTGKLLRPFGELDLEEAVTLFGEVVRLGKEEGADLILIETMSDSYESKAAVLAAHENSDLPVVVTNIYDSRHKLLTGGGTESTVALLEGLGVDALGVNCGLGPKEMLPIVKELAEITSVPLVVSPNAGLPRAEGGRTVYDVSPEEFAREMEKIAALGIQVAGGCCGTTPEHIRSMREALEKLPFRPREKKRRTVVSSYARAEVLGEKPVLIGERLNPTGKKRLQQALREEDMDYLLGEGLKQEKSGAGILDVNVGLPGIDEAALLTRATEELQSVLDLPLQLDTADPVALERAMRRYNGKPMVNSVSGKKESMETVFPLLKRYGGVAVALPLTEAGIPDSARGRIEVAKTILREAENWGIGPEDLVLDGLTMTISSDPGAAMTTLETIRLAREELGLHTILGVSNVSFGLPRREIVNAHFLTLAMGLGLSAAIMNPGSEAMMQSYRSYLALTAKDENCMDYIAAYAGTTAPTGGGAAAKTVSAAAAAGSLKEAVERGLKDLAVSETKQQLLNREPLEIIDGELIPALDTVGQGFEKGTLFLPQLLMSAEAAKAAFEVIKGKMAGRERETKGRILLATVKGDIHDIGKNIVKVLLENYGYEILDLGKDVDPETVAETAVRENIALVGLSALMTTTVVNMEATIRLLRKRKPDTKIVVGGAVMTKDYAEKIGADRYARDAMATVRYADEVFGADTIS